MEEELRFETEKWLNRADEAFQKLTFQDKEGEWFSTNIAAYLSDSRHFLEKNDLIRAFEAVIWAWAWIEIGLDIDLLTTDENLIEK
jgi:hypothetical protein